MTGRKAGNAAPGAVALVATHTRNFEIFSPCDFIAAITQHIPDKSFQVVRYYGWYSNRMRGQRYKREATEAQPDAGRASDRRIGAPATTHSIARLHFLLHSDTLPP